jgi:hypothetical protein
MGTDGTFTIFLDTENRGTSRLSPHFRKGGPVPVTLFGGTIEVKSTGMQT